MTLLKSSLESLLCTTWFLSAFCSTEKNWRHRSHFYWKTCWTGLLQIILFIYSYKVVWHEHSDQEDSTSLHVDERLSNPWSGTEYMIKNGIQELLYLVGRWLSLIVRKNQRFQHKITFVKKRSPNLATPVPHHPPLHRWPSHCCLTSFSLPSQEFRRPRRKITPHPQWTMWNPSSKSAIHSPILGWWGWACTAASCKP